MNRRALRPVAGLLVVAVLAAGCTIPRERSAVEVNKPAVTADRAQEIFDRYREVRNAAIGLLDPRPLSIVESGAVLAIDTGSFEVAQQLSTDRAEIGPIEVRRVLTPVFSEYPLWFVAVVREADADVQRVQVFERTRAVDPWLLVATPEVVADAELPSIRTGGEGVAVTVDPANGRGLAASPQDAAVAYAETLAGLDPDSDGTDDDFVLQMRRLADQNASLDGVDFEQSWAAEDVRFVLRTSDGGALAFVTLARDDTYRVPAGLSVRWPEGSAQAAFLDEGITGSGTLQYRHQVLLQLPPGDGAPRAIGQFGGFVGLAD
ncbi:hypothetical protein HMPREF0063_12255 [Aeromicrobium marinum DSM 15272]|uniref:DUF8094 domain-containing protein n=1 Tax=Aeromicrobium marinum DSM 15272 TaxID=585531 RepID=E2SCU3_9ACTN|nr:hypothetical protein [Aeromicrobium marinum]EFQ83046.1 hypothetical protein HMPREF0063_12255 [Aeromicrobium marinum DSM 15272]